MFSPAERARLRDELVAAARADERISGVALTGSAAVGAEDPWSDIDLALGVAGDVEPVIADWTQLMYREHGTLEHTDLTRGSTLYRVFLLASTLQVDLAFSPAAEFGAIAPTFRLLDGHAEDLPHVPEPVAGDLIGTAWLYALHVRSCIARGRRWQAEYMISGIRDQVLALACVRHGVPAVQGRGLHRLPVDVADPVTDSLVRSLDVDELVRAFRAVTAALLAEIARADASHAHQLGGVLNELVDSIPVR